MDTYHCYRQNRTGHIDAAPFNSPVYTASWWSFEDDTSTAKSASQAVIIGNVFFLSSDSGTAQQAINYDDVLSSTYPSGTSFGSGLPVSEMGGDEQASSQQGGLIIADNVFYASNISTFCTLNGWGIIVRGNIFDFAGNTPWNQPLARTLYGSATDASDEWPLPAGTGISVKGNDILIEGNIFRNAGVPDSQYQRHRGPVSGWLPAPTCIRRYR